MPIILKKAVKTKSEKIEKTAVHTRICPANSESPSIWSAIATLATAWGEANKANRAAYSAPEKLGKPNNLGTKITILIPTIGAKNNFAITLTVICGNNFFTEDNYVCKYDTDTASFKFYYIVPEDITNINKYSILSDGTTISVLEYGFSIEVISNIYDNINRER